MIAELDEALKQLLKDTIPLDTAEVDINFEMPTKDWSAGLARPTLNLYLFDIRENLEFRENDWMRERTNGEAVKRLTPSRIDLAYLVTAWTSAVEDEHRLLWYTLAGLFRHPELPEKYLKGPLAGQVVPIRFKVAQPDGVLKNPADFWSAMENRLKPAVNLVVTVPLDLAVEIKGPIVLTKRLSMELSPGAAKDEIVQIAGRVRIGGRPATGASVLLEEKGLSVRADAEGHYTFPNMPAGAYTLVVTPPGKAAKRRKIAVPQREYDVDV